MDHSYSRHATFEFNGEAFEPTNLPQFDLKFHFQFTSLNNHYILNLNQDPPQSLFLITPSFNGTTSAAFGGSPSLEAAVWAAVAGRLHGGERRRLTELVRNQIRTKFAEETLPRQGILHLYFVARVEHRHVYIIGGGDGGGPHMVPAGEAAFALLEEFEVGRARADVDVDEEERCCSICLEELGGGGAARMPCKHVFHGGCIKKWLGKSHYCPLCRYEMPTE